MALYDTIGIGYDSTRRADPYITQRLIYHLNLKRGAKCMNVGCGTGNYSRAIVSMTDVEMVGVDQSKPMIETASEKVGSVVWFVGDAESLPFPDDTFSGALFVLAVHHFKNSRLGFREAFRVLAKGRLVIFTATSEQIRGYWLNEYFPEAMEKSAEQMISLGSIVECLRLADFNNICSETYEVSNELQDLFLYSGKYRPEIYLDPRVRSGISSFAKLADSHEVEEGCKKLVSDIRSGRITEVVAGYRHDKGDYVFVVAEKRR